MMKKQSSGTEMHLNLKILTCSPFRGQFFFNIALVLQDERLTIFTHPTNTCAHPLKAYAIKNIREQYD